MNGRFAQTHLKHFIKLQKSSKTMIQSFNQERLHKEIDLIQSCINRMAKNSFSCKGWNLTLIAGIFTLMPINNNNWYFALLIICINSCFWFLDSFFLLQERKYRDKYEWVIKKRLEGNTDFLYDLNPNNKRMNLKHKKQNLFKSACSLTLMSIYGGITALVVIFIIIKFKKGV